MTSAQFAILMAIIGTLGFGLGWVSCAYWHEYAKQQVQEVRDTIERQRASGQQWSQDSSEKRPAATNEQPTGKVYFIVPDGRDVVRIGYSSRVKRQLADMQASSPDNLSIALEVDGTEALESALHQRFRDSRIRGEWYRLSLPIQHYMVENRNSGVRQS